MHRNSALILVILLLIPSVGLSETPSHISKALESTVMILAFDDDYQPISIGSGFAVSQDGAIVTNYHVIEGASSAIIKLIGHNEKYKVVTVLHKSPELDLAVLGIKEQITPCSLGDDTLANIGDRIIAIGNPEGLEGTVSEGIISGFRKIDENFRLIQITAPISPGSSGGPIIGNDGKIIGIASASIVSGQNLNFAIPVSILKRMLSKEESPLPMASANVKPRQKATAFTTPQNANLVKILNMTWSSASSSYCNLQFSIQNNTPRDIRNIKILLIWMQGREKIHFNPLLIKDIIPAQHAKLVEKTGDGVKSTWITNLGNQYSYEARILDYELLHTSGAMEFK